MSFISYQRVINSFQPVTDYDKIVSINHGSFETQIILDKKGEYSPGEMVKGQVHFKLRRKLRLFALLVVLDGRISSKVPYGQSQNRVWTETVTNLHIFTYIFKSSRKTEAILCPGSSTYPFSIRIPLTALPGSFSSPHGSISYRVILIGTNNPGVHGILTQEPFHLHPHLPVITSMGPFSNRIKKMELAKESWQTRKRTQIQDDLPKFRVIHGCGNKGNTGVQLERSDKGSGLKVLVDLPSLEFTFGEMVPFHLSLSGPKGLLRSIQRFSLSLYLKIIYTGMGSLTEVKKVVEVLHKNPPGVPDGSRSSISWNSEIRIPEDLSSGSTLAAMRTPIIFQYSFRVQVKAIVNGETVLILAQVPIIIGTETYSNSNSPSPSSKQPLLDPELCKYPIGISPMSYPEDWEQMYKSGRIGYVENLVDPSMSTQGLKLQEDFGGGRMEAFGSFASLTCSTQGSFPPRYSTLTSRRSSICSCPPSYNEATK